MRILVTGGAGFVGSHLVDRLLKEGHEVICVDSFYSGKRENVAHHFNNPNFTLIKHDIRQALKLSEEKLDRIYNLACPASPVQYQFDPVLTLETSVIGVQNMLQLARRTGARVLHASTSEVYGDPLEHPQKESYWGNVDPLGKRACYDEGKRAAETLCKDYHEEYGVDVRLIRIFNTYGPRMMFNDGRVLSNFILQALLGEDITVHGDGMQTRSFMYIDDLVEGTVRRMEVESTDWGPVNLGNPDERTIKDLAERVVEHTKTNSKIVLVPFEKIPSRLGDPKQRCPDIACAKNLLGWEPVVPLEVGLEKTVADFKDRLQHRPRIVVFSPDYLAVPETTKAVEEIVTRLPGWEFDVITRHTSTKEKDRITVHTVSGAFAWRAARLAKKLFKQHQYQVAWTLAPRVGILAAALFSRSVHGQTPVLLSVYTKTVTPEMLARGRASGFIYRRLFKHFYCWQVVGAMKEKDRVWLEDQSRVYTVPFTGDWDRVAQHTKEIFQELEIASSRV